MIQKYKKPKGIIDIIKKNFLSIPLSIRILSFSLFLFTLGRGLGADAFFSIYIGDILDNIFLISLVWAILSLGKMFFSIPVGEINGRADIKSVLFLSKWAYAITGTLFFLSGIFSSPILLLIGVAINGFGTATLLITYQTFIRKHSKQNTRGLAFGLYFSSMNLAYVVWALLASVLIGHIQMPYLFLFIPIFALISFSIDKKLPDTNDGKTKELMSKGLFVRNFFLGVFSFRPIKNVIVRMKDYSTKLYYALGFEFLFNILNYIGFIFIPIISIKNDLTLSQVAIVFAVMKVPYLIDFFIGNIADKTGKRKFLFFVLLFISFLYMLLGYNEWFRNIITITFAISLGLSLMRPVISAYTSDCAGPEDEWAISGVSEFVSRLWEVIGILLFGAFSALFGVQISFLLVGVGIFMLASIWLINRFHLFRKTNR